MRIKISEAALLHINREDEDYFLCLLPGYTSLDVEAALTTISTMGLEVLTLDEHEGKQLDDDTMLIWLAEKSPT